MHGMSPRDFCRSKEQLRVQWSFINTRVLFNGECLHVYGFYHGKSTCFTTIWKNMCDSLFPTTLAKQIGKCLVRKSINQPEWWFFWNFLPNRSVQPVVPFGWRLANETNEVLFITANQPSPEPPPQTYPAGNKAEIKGLLSLGGWLISHDFMVREWGLKLPSFPSPFASQFLGRLILIHSSSPFTRSIESP